MGKSQGREYKSASTKLPLFDKQRSERYLHKYSLAIAILRNINNQRLHTLTTNAWCTGSGKASAENSLQAKPLRAKI